MRSFRECVAVRGTANAGLTDKKIISDRRARQTDVARNQCEMNSAGPLIAIKRGGAIRHPLRLPADRCPPLRGLRRLPAGGSDRQLWDGESVRVFVADGSRASVQVMRKRSVALRQTGRGSSMTAVRAQPQRAHAVKTLQGLRLDRLHAPESLSARRLGRPACWRVHLNKVEGPADSMIKRRWRAPSKRAPRAAH